MLPRQATGKEKTVDTRIGRAEEATAAQEKGGKMKSKKNIARMAGLLYLVPMLVGPFSLLYVPTTLIVPGDAATTASNIMASEGHFVRWPHGQEGADDEGARGANGNGEYQGKPA
jgi:hypothetical protein